METLQIAWSPCLGPCTFQYIAIEQANTNAFPVLANVPVHYEATEEEKDIVNIYQKLYQVFLLRIILR